MSKHILQSDAKKFIERYHAACNSKGESSEKVIRFFEISKKALQDIFAAAELHNTPCEKIRIYFGKETGFDANTNYPKFSTEDDYNLIIVGVDDKGVNINSTGEIYDHLLSVAGAPSNDF